jgi:serine/threonine protein kinase
MTPARWARITDLVRATLDLPPAGRPAFLDSACGTDDALRREVERILAGADASSFVSPAPALLDSAVLDLLPGEALGHYRLESKIGQGGMGAVYRAYDTVLRRKVALKILAPERLPGGDTQRWLLREARAASAISHPNIITIFEVSLDREPHFIAMEFVEGNPLGAVIPPSGLALPSLLRYAVQIAAALAHAHGCGILHRDLKPSNILVSADGHLKLLDFGLAKNVEAAPADSEALTAPGVFAGTSAYMSPEQAQGRKLDVRSDLFSFGTVLYEMATGRRPFTADSRLELLHRIVHDDPPPTTLPRAFEKIIFRCLRKDPAERYQNATELREALEALIQHPPPPRRVHARALAVSGIALGVIVTALVFGARLLNRPPASIPGRTIKFTITPTNLLRTGSPGEIDAEVSVSRDGKHIAYVESSAGQLWIRDLDQEQPRLVPGATSVYQVFWSPDNQSIGYSAGRLCGITPGCDLVRIPVQGGTPSLIARLNGPFRRASWSADGETILFCDTSGMYTVPARGGSVTRIVQHPHIEHPSFLDLPDGRHAYLYQTGNPGTNNHSIWVQLPGSSPQRILESRSGNPYPAYSPTGHIVYVDGDRDNTAIWAIPFSLSTLQPTGKPFVIAQNGASPAVSLSGTLVYSDIPSGRRQFIWVDRAGRQRSTTGDPERQRTPVLSPDGRKLAAAVSTGGPPAVWVYDLDRNIKTRFTSGDAPNLPASWSSDGREIRYSSGPNLFSKPFTTPGDPRPLGPLDQTAAQTAPSGDYVAYVSRESGAQEVYVREAAGTHRWQVSPSGGVGPRWSRNGKELFYVDGNKFVAVPVATRPTFTPGAPVVLFERPYLRALTGANVSPFPEYDVSPDAQRFIVLDRSPTEPPLSIHIVNNWYAEFSSLN